MCLGIPGKIVEIWDEENGARMAHADFAGELRRVCLAYLPDLAIGDYTLAHAGFALTRLDESAARETLRLMRDEGLLPALSQTSPEAVSDAASGVVPNAVPGAVAEVAR